MRAFAILAILTALTACSSPDNGSMPFRAIGPEQSTFLVTPADPLEVPPVLTLPQPTPGGTNRATQ